MSAYHESLREQLRQKQQVSRKLTLRDGDGQSRETTIYGRDQDELDHLELQVRRAQLQVNAREKGGRAAVRVDRPGAY